MVLSPLNFRAELSSPILYLYKADYTQPPAPHFSLPFPGHGAALQTIRRERALISPQPNTRYETVHQCFQYKQISWLNVKNWLIHDHLLLPQYILNQTVKAGLLCPQRPVSLQWSNLFLGQITPASNRTWFWANPRRRQAGTLSPAANWSRAPQLSWSSPFI